MVGNMNQITLRKYLGFGATAISSYENGRNELSVDTLIQIDEYFDVTVDYLLGVADSQKWMEQLPEEEVNLLYDFRKLGASEKELVSSMIKALNKGRNIMKERLQGGIVGLLIGTLSAGGVVYAKGGMENIHIISKCIKTTSYVT